MRIYRFVSVAIGSVLMASASSAAFAGCGFGPGCPSVVNHGPAQDSLAPIQSYSTTPFGHLKTVEYKNTPNVHTMRVHSISSCGSSSPTCNRAIATPRPIMPRPIMHRPVMPAPVYMAPAVRAPMPVIARPVATHNVDRTPRLYGSLELVRGIAHIPTSIVDRSPITHIDGVPQQQVSSVTTTTGHYPSTSSSYGMSRSYVPAPTMPASVITRPVAPQPRMNGNVIGHVNGGSYAYQAPGGGQYWEKTSGPTMIDGMLATKVLCRRSAPRPTPVRVNVVRPVIGVPYPVPTAVPVQVRPTCAPAPFARHSGARYSGARHSGFGQQQLAGGPSNADSRYGSRWTQ